MNQLNSIILEGNIVNTIKNDGVLGLTLAVTRHYKLANGEAVDDVSYFDIETYDKLAEFAEKQSEKGRGVRVVGRLKQNRWTDDDGKKRAKVFVVAEHIEFKPFIKKAEEN